MVVLTVKMAMAISMVMTPLRMGVVMLLGWLTTMVMTMMLVTMMLVLLFAMMAVVLGVVPMVTRNAMRVMAMRAIQLCSW